jgi:hypothetical protein
MNANEISPKTNPRMDRIKKVSANLRAFFHFCAVMGGIVGVLQIISVPIELIFHQTICPQTNIDNKFGLGGCITLTWAAGSWFAYKLFFLYARGDLFSAEIVRCIRRIGFVSILLGVERFFSGVALGISSHSPVGLPMLYLAVLPVLSLPLLSSVIPGFAIVVIAWIMDEGRKIQEEQELTV